MGTDLEDLPHLRKATMTHTAAIFFGELTDLIRNGSLGYIRAQGTITFVRYRNRCYGITNHHVYAAATSRTHVWHLALKHHEHFRQKPLLTSTEQNPDLPLDIAIFLLDEDLIRKGGKLPIDLESDATLVDDERLLAVGFPRQARATALQDGIYASHGAYHAVAKAALSDRTIFLHEELDDQTDKTWDFGGMSGGPIFKTLSPTSYELAGIIYEASKSPRVNTISLRGFRFGKTQLEKVLSLCLTE